MIRGKFLAQDDFDLAGHRLRNWQWISDIPTREGEEGQTIAIVDGVATWATLYADGIVIIEWDDILNKPTEFPPEAHTHPWGEVTGKPTFVNTLAAGQGLSVSAATGNVTVSTVEGTDQTEPTGFPNRTDSTMSFDDATRTFTIEPAVDSFDVYCLGNKFTYTAAQTVVIDLADAEGLWFFMFGSDGTLEASQTFTVDTMAEKALCALFYWDETNDEALGLADERHGIVMDGRTHGYLHLTRGTAIESGFGLGDIDADASGNDDTSAQMSTANGVMWDEDIRLEIVGESLPATMPVLYMDGATGTWRKNTPSYFPVILYPAGRAAYNELVGTTWQQTEVVNNRYFLMHILAVNRQDSPFYVAIQGQNEYISRNAAQAGALSEIGDLITIGLPMPEFAIVGTIIFQTSDGYTNAVKSRVISTDEGGDYISWIDVALSPTSGPSDHGGLTGLSDKDHPLVALQQSGAVDNNGILWSDYEDAWIPSSVVRISSNAFHDDFAEATGPSGTNIILTEAAAGSQRYTKLSNLPISTATQSALDTKSDTTHTHLVTDVTDWATASITMVGLDLTGDLEVDGNALADSVTVLETGNGTKTNIESSFDASWPNNPGSGVYKCIVANMTIASESGEINLGSIAYGLYSDIDLTNNSPLFVSLRVHPVYSTFNASALKLDNDVPPVYFEFTGPASNQLFSKGYMAIDVSGGSSAGDVIALGSYSRISGAASGIGYKGYATGASGTTGKIVGILGVAFQATGGTYDYVVGVQGQVLGTASVSANKIMGISANKHALISDGSLFVAVDFENYPAALSPGHVQANTNTGELYVESIAEFDGEVFFDANESHSHTVITANYTAVGLTNILANAASGTITVTLPAASGVDQRQYVVKKTDSSANTVIIDGNASETIDGATTYNLAAQYDGATILCDGSNWHVIGTV